MAYLDIVTALALLEFVAFGFRVGAARERFGVKAPAISGHEIFERHFRVQQNTLELLIAFIPGLYLFGHYFDPRWAAGLGILFLIGRALYARAYVKDPAQRSAGFALSFLPTMVLLLGGLVGALLRLARP